MMYEFTSMISKSEEARITAFAQAMEADTIAVEIGCWVGESTKAILRGFQGPVHLIDTFEWSRAHDEKYPGILPIGADFRDVTRTNLQAFVTDGRLHFHRSAAEAFEPGALGQREIGLLVLDGPKDRELVQEIILLFAPLMAKEGVMVIKHVASPHRMEMLDLMIRLLAAGVLQPAFEFPATGNDSLVSFRAGEVAAVPDELLASTWLSTFDTSMKGLLAKSTYGPLLPLIWLVEKGHLDGALSRAEGIAYAPSLLMQWAGLQDHLMAQSGVDLSTLIEIEMKLTG